MKRVLFINGPNLNLLGTREPAVYGRQTLADIESRVRARADSLACSVDFRQSNSEGEIVGWLQGAAATHDAVVLNPAGFTHYSQAIGDAVAGSRLPIYEVHLSNVHAREPWRRKSVVSPGAAGVIAGLGAIGYELALEAAVGSRRV